MVIIQDLIDDAKCLETVRTMRWPDGIPCPHCSSDSVIEKGRDDTPPHRRRSECRASRQRFDDLTDTLFAGHHQPLRTGTICLYLMGLNPSGLRIAKERDRNQDDARARVQHLRPGTVDRRPPVTLPGTVECDEVSIGAGHKGHPEAVERTGGSGVVGVSKGSAAGGHRRTRGRRPSGRRSATARSWSGCWRTSSR